MKKLNTKKMIAQRGGLMIEALAMLGLIAVVTPTMYKKSAERTLEVEDINTATTMRTYLDAAEAYVNNNYASLMTESGTDKEITLADYKQYLPYGYQDKQLYDFGEPKVKIHKDGMNLTAFVTFPAKEAGGLGKERTSRIASLIGSNGGYVTLDEEAEVEEGEEQPNKARGVGGIWTLKGGEYDNIVGDVHQNSIVMASAGVINDINGDELESDKYLSRIPEGSGRTPDYRNTMRTDIYMGGMGDNETLDGYGTASHSIRNISSLIVGAEKASETTNSEGITEEDAYGLYISDGAANKNAFIAGTLEAVKEGDQPMFKVDTDNLTYGDLVGSEDPSYSFVVSRAGNIENYGSLDLAKNPMNSDVKIGTLGYHNHHNEHAGASDTYVNGATTENYYFRGRNIGVAPRSETVASNQDIASMMNESRFAVGSDGVDLSAEYNISGMNDLGTRVMIEGGSNVKGTYDEEGNLIPSSEIKYTSAPKFPVAVGSNMVVDGVLAARQMDAQHVRMATLSAGSENIDDPSSGKWLNVNANGVKIGKTVEDSANGAYFSDNKIQIGTDWNNSGSSEDTYDTLKTNTGAYLVMGANVKNTDPETGITTYSATGGRILMGNGAMQMALIDESDSETGAFGNGNLIVGGVVRDDGSKTDDAKVVTRFEGGNVHLQDANLNVNRLNTEGNVKPVFSVRGNSSQTTSGYDETTNGSDRNYDVAVHGKMLVTSEEVIEGDEKKKVKYLSVGTDSILGNETDHDDTAMVRIMNAKIGDDVDDNLKTNIVTIEPQKQTYSQRKSDGTFVIFSKQVDDGRIYMRKGLIEVTNPGGDTVNSDLEPDDASGSVVARRLVANNSKQFSNDISFVHTSKDGTDETPADNFRAEKNSGSQNLYDTYMVNPAYTSVMNDIKLASRGGARLSDILPDFITKGIYIVTNSYKEKSGDLNTSSNYESATDSQYRSAFMGMVGQPACPPGYARVITVNPVSFPVGGTIAYRIADNEYETTQKVDVVEGKVDLPKSVVLNDQLHSVTLETDTHWKILMGYPYRYSASGEVDSDTRTLEKNNNKDKTVTYWNLVPITSTSIAGYATTYCYFDRVGVLDGYRYTGQHYDDKVDPNKGYSSSALPDDADGRKQNLNDPQLKYDEVW